jgi:predicted nucleic acid-binding protein
MATVTPGGLILSVVAGDEADNRYLECAIEGSADYLVTGDRRLLDLGSYEHVRIVSARGFLAVLSELERSG